MGDGSRILGIALAVLAAALAIGGATASYMRSSIVDRDSFTDRGVAALQDDTVRGAASEQIADSLIDNASGDLLAVRPLLVTAFDALLVSDAFRPVLRLALDDAHRVLLESGQRPVIVDLSEAGGLIVRALRSVSPEVAGEVPEGIEVALLELDAADFEVGGARALDGAGAFAWWLLAGAALALVAALLSGADRRAVTEALGYALALFAALVLTAVAVGGELVGRHVADDWGADTDRGRAVVEGVWSSYFGDLRAQALAGVVAGLMLAAVASASIEPGALVGRVRRAGARIAGPQPTPRLRLARAVLAALAGAALLVEPDASIRLAAMAAGCVLLLLAAEEAVAGLERLPGARRRTAARGSEARRLALVAGAIGAIVLPGAGLAIALSTGNPPVDPVAAPREGCNGLRALCDRRLNEVVFPGTHNSFAAAEEDGWLFANQGRGIASQLEDGIRLLLVDPHNGRRTPDGEVRTDLSADGVDRNRVANRLTPRALAVADRVAGRVGGGGTGGERGVFLCHTLCELGAVAMVDELRAVGDFLDSNPNEVVILLVEPFVTPSELERVFRDAGLFERLATLDRRSPLPTLGELIAADERVVVFTERGGGRPSWYLDGFSFIQDTPLGATEADELSCERARGDADNPLLMINHWIDRFPPPVGANERIGRRSFLLERARACQRERRLLPNLIAVDFYDRTSVVAVARELNESHEPGR